MSLFDEHNLAEISHPDYPGERLICCRNPVLAAQRARKRQELLAATAQDLAKIKQAADAGKLTGADKIGERVGKVIDKHKVGKHFIRDITDTSFTFGRDEEKIAAEAAFDGIYGRFQSVMATQCSAISSSKTSIGFRQFSVSRGLPFSSAATLSSSSWVCKDRSVPFGKYCRSNPFVFSLVPRCHGECGSQK